MTQVNVGRAKTELSQLLARAEAGEEIEIARNGVSVVRLVPVKTACPADAFFAARGALQGQIRIADDFEFTDDELDEMLA